MASPVRFCGFNRRFLAPKGQEDHVATLHVHSNGVENISCWRLAPEEIEHIVKTGEVWLTTRSGDAFFPSAISGLPMMAAWDADTNEPCTYYSDGRHVIEDARQFATLHHGDQRYSADRPYGYHLERVAQVMIDFGLTFEFVAAGWLHDFLEDCLLESTTPEDRRQMIVDRFGDFIGNLVWACTGLTVIDGIKQNRKLRNAQQYVKIAAFEPAALLKVGDRIANLEAAILDKWASAAMYLKEREEFDSNVTVLVPQPMQDRLAAAYTGVEDFLQA